MKKKTERAIFDNSETADDVAYILEFPNAPQTNGVIRFVKWVHGHGVLDRRAVADSRPDLVDPRTFKLKASWDVLAETAKYWADRGCIVKKTTAAKAAPYRERLEKHPESFLPKPPAAAAPSEDPNRLVKVSELAKEFNMKTADVLAQLAGAGIDAKGPTSNVPAAEARAAIVPPPTESEEPGGAGKAPHEE